MILTYDLVSRIIVSGAYLLYYLMYESQIVCVLIPLGHTILGHFDLDIDFWPHCQVFMSGAYLLYYSLLSSNVSYARPIPLGSFVT